MRETLTAWETGLLKRATIENISGKAVSSYSLETIDEKFISFLFGELRKLNN